MEDNHAYRKLVFFTILTWFVYSIFQGHFLSQLHSPVLKTTGIDNTYWLFCILGIPQFIIRHSTAADVLLWLMFFISFGINNKWLYRSFFALAAVHIITFNIYSGVHSKSCIALPFMILPFCFPGVCDLLKRGVRYYFLFVFVSAAIYKIINGGLFYPQQLVHILQNQHTELGILNPSHFTFRLSSYLEQNPNLSTVFWVLFFLLELVFIVGFFTRKFDKLLLANLAILVLLTFAVMRISLVEFLLFSPVLIFSVVKKPQNARQ